MGDNKNIKIEHARQRFENDNKICKHKLNYKQNMKKKFNSHIKNFYINTREVGQKISFFFSLLFLKGSNIYIKLKESTTNKV